MTITIEQEHDLKIRLMNKLADMDVNPMSPLGKEIGRRCWVIGKEIEDLETLMKVEADFRS